MASVILYLVLLGLGLIYTVIYGLRQYVVYTYWKKLKVPHAAPIPPFGNTWPVILGLKSLGSVLDGYYNKYKKERFFGLYMFLKPVLMINDPELIRLVMVKDADKFSSRGMFFNELVDPMTIHKLFVPGDNWKKVRAKLSPLFTSKKIKDVLPLMQKSTATLMKTVDEALASSNVVEIKDLMGRYTVDTMGPILFGFEPNSLGDPHNEIKRCATMVFSSSPQKIAFGSFAPILHDILRIPSLDTGVFQSLTRIFGDIVKLRKESGVKREDLLNSLLQLMSNEKSSTDEMDDIQLSAMQAQVQAFIFFAASYETPSSMMTYLLYELALNPKIQSDVHQEIDQFFANGEPSYERMRDELTYLDMAISETMRKNCPVGALNRICTEDWKIPDSDVVIKRGTGVTIALSAIHHDPEIYPDPETFDPERFTAENIAFRPPYVYMPFGEGPKNCIASRLGTVTGKVALLTFLHDYEVRTCEKTVIPMEYSKKSFATTPASGVYLELHRRIH